MNFEVRVKMSGAVVNRVTLSAFDALSAIEQVERTYTGRQARLGDRPVVWTGRTYQARQLVGGAR